MSISAKMEPRAPFPWYGGKRREADRVWALLGNVTRYIEPFAGSLGVLLGRAEPWSGLEVVNDLDGYVVNAWRSIKQSPEETAEHATGLISELDCTARHIWLVNEGRRELNRLAADPEWHDPKIAGWWLHGVAAWIGTGYCAGDGPWTRAKILGESGVDGQGVNRKLPHLGDDGRGVNRQERCRSYMKHLANRLKDVVVTCGDWQRVLTPSAMATRSGQPVGVFLDPPYRDHGREYGTGNAGVEDIWQRLEGWLPTITQNMRVIVCGYDGDLAPPTGWTTIEYTAKGTGSHNRIRERMWASPGCLSEQTLFGAEACR